MTTVNYEADVVAWANEQAWLVRNKKFELLDIEHIAEEIEKGSRYFCERLFWASQPKQSAKT